MKVHKFAIILIRFGDRVAEEREKQEEILRKMRLLNDKIKAVDRLVCGRYLV